MVDRSGRLGHWWRLWSLSCFFFPSCRYVTSSPRLCVAVEIPGGWSAGRDFQRVWEGPGRRAGGGPELSMPGQIPQPGWGAWRAEALAARCDRELHDGLSAAGGTSALCLRLDSPLSLSW